MKFDFGAIESHLHFPFELQICSRFAMNVACFGFARFIDKRAPKPVVSRARRQLQTKLSRERRASRVGSRRTTLTMPSSNHDCSNIGGGVGVNQLVSLSLFSACFAGALLRWPFSGYIRMSRAQILSKPIPCLTLPLCWRLLSACCRLRAVCLGRASVAALLFTFRVCVNLAFAFSFSCFQF